MKKICFYLGDVHAKGGISRVTWIIANRLIEEFKVSVLAYFHNKEKRYEYSDEIQTDYLFEDKKSVYKRFPKLVWKIREYIKKNDIDVLICASVIYFPACVGAVLGTKTKLICWEHSNTTVNNEHKFQGLCRKIGATFADAVVVLTKKDEQLYQEKFGKGNYLNIYNPIDERLMIPVNYDIASKKIISVGRFCYAKNFELLVDVANVILSKYPDWNWDIFGDGEQKEIVEQKIRRYNLENRLHLMGNIQDLYERYANYSFLVMTSRYEGFPMTLLESTAKGLPAVSFDILTGPSEIIDEGITGFLVEPENVEQMAARIGTLIENEQLRLEMSRKCVEKREMYSTAQIVERWIDTINRV